MNFTIRTETLVLLERTLLQSERRIICKFSALGTKFPALYAIGFPLCLMISATIHFYHHGNQLLFGIPMFILFTHDALLSFPIL